MTFEVVLDTFLLISRSTNSPCSSAIVHELTSLIATFVSSWILMASFVTICLQIMQGHKYILSVAAVGYSFVGCVVGYYNTNFRKFKVTSVCNQRRWSRVDSTFVLHNRTVGYLHISFHLALVLVSLRLLAVQAVQNPKAQKKKITKKNLIWQ